MRNPASLRCRAILALSAIVFPWSAHGASPAGPAPARVSLDDLFSEVRMPDVAISPSGRYLAGVLIGDGSSTVFVTDLENGTTRNVVGVGRDAISDKVDTVISAVFWKSDDRLLFRMGSYPRDGARFVYRWNNLKRLGDRLLAVDRDGTDMVPLLVGSDARALAGAFGLGTIKSFLPHDPAHIMMSVYGVRGYSLFRVDVNTGQGELVDPPSAATIDWWLDVDGVPLVRIEEWGGSFRLRRKDAAGDWKVFYKVRARERDEGTEYEPVGPAEAAGEYYVLARPEGRERVGLYRYDLTQEAFGEPVFEHPRFDLVSAAVSRDGKRVLRYCFVEHTLQCRFADPAVDGHMRSVRKYFDDSANVSVYDASADEKVLILRVDGPSTPPSFHTYRTERRRLEGVGALQERLRGRALPRAKVVEWQARDGLSLSGYLTLPPGADDAKSLPLVVHPHGGPESRDLLRFDPWTQYLAARGYAVFQPNFRGSDGFGRTFAALGYGQWGRAMQDDVTDGVRHLAAQGTIDPARVCIVGASYGGYAALAGAALTPDLYRCAVSIAGVSDLAAFIAWRKSVWGSDEEGYTYWLKAIGDPGKDRAALDAASPAKLAAKITVPVLLIHGDQDRRVPMSQSVAMKKALDKAGRRTALITLEDEGHTRWSDANERSALESIGRFLWDHLGPGQGADRPPPPASGAGRD
jgi:dipeptidyl aminopeptidase/acylaminoacyl peptidase